ncbi:MAG: type II toxin-antitoxin system HicB family antitoxin [Spirochaetota bacterium]
MKINVIIKKDETDYYYAEVPAMPGCLSQGKTLDEVKVNIKQAMELWIEVMNEKAEKMDKDNIYEVSC